MEKMKFTPLTLPDAYKIEIESRGDSRGKFSRLFCAKQFQQIAFDKTIVNVYHSYTATKGTIRGMHFQYPPDCEIKIVKCIRGAIWDCMVDIRKDSSTFLQWEASELTDQNDTMMYVPEGFAHGFQSLTDDVEVLYCVTNFYSSENEGGLRFDDPRLGITWPLELSVISDRDRAHPLLDDRFEGIVLP